MSMVEVSESSDINFYIGFEFVFSIVDMGLFNRG
jgi:hypothetical protein